MLCAKPIDNGRGQMVGCGQCMNCEVNKRRAWTARLLLEGNACEDMAHGEVSWCTLTYNEDALPMAYRGTSAPVPTLNPRDYQLLFKQLRKPKRLGSFRFGLVGEYGDRFGRPHYHALIFGPPVAAVETHLRETWGTQFGFTTVMDWRMPSRADGKYQLDDGRVREARARYIAHYVTKKMNSVDSEKLHPAQVPEFWRCSRHPGIGCTRGLLDLVESRGGVRLMSETGDVPATVRIGKDVWPLHQNVRSWLRRHLGIPETKEERFAMFGPPRVERPQPSLADYERAAKQCGKMTRQAKAKDGRVL